MASVHPFRALRPPAESAARVSSVPYDVVSTDEARAQAAGNPLSFLHVTRSEIDLPPETDPYSDRVYEQAVRNFEELKRSAPLVLEPEPAVYFYRLRVGAHEQTGVAATYSLDEYERDAIKKHERTRREKEDDRTRHIIHLRAQTGVVFLTYRASADVDTVADKVCASRPLYDFTAPDGVAHSVWRVERAETHALAAAFSRVPALYIADGHHRAASAARARTELRATGEAAGAFDMFLAVAFPDNQVQILPYNRTVKDLAGRSPEEFLAALRSCVPVREGAPAPVRTGEVSLYLGGRWYALDLRPLKDAAGADRIGALDVSVLQRHVLDGLLKITDPRTDKRIDFVGGIRGPGELERLVQTGRAAAAFSMSPVRVDDLMSIADAGGIMPPKSTWFEPKLRDGLLIHLI
jgi:uncharacterized protein (DUF1015 family)